MAATKEALEAAYLYKFLYFISWPQGADATPELRDILSICVVGKNPFGHLLAPIEGKRILQSNRRITINYAQSLEELKEVDVCHLLYLAMDDGPEMRQVLNYVRDLPVVTVSNNQNFLDYGGIIRLLVKDGRLRWEINMKQARRVQVGISSQLLRNALRVIK